MDQVNELCLCASGFSVNLICLYFPFIKHGESSSYPPRLSRKGKRNRGNDVSTTGRHSHKGRRVVKNDGEVTFAPIILDLSTDDQLCEIDRQHTEAAVTSTLSRHVNIDNIQENSEGPDVGLSCQKELSMEVQMALRKEEIQIIYLLSEIQLSL